MMWFPALLVKAIRGDGVNEIDNLAGKLSYPLRPTELCFPESEW